MKVLTKYPVYINDKKVSNSDVYSYLDDTLPEDPFSYLDDAGKAGLITAGVGAATAIGAALASRQRAPLSEIETKCGKRPRIGKKKKQAWQDCANRNQSAPVQMPIATLPIATATPDADKNKKYMIYAGVGIAVLLLGFLVYKKMKTPTPTAVA